MPFCIYRHQEGITLNPKEYLLTDSGELKTFPHFGDAEQFLTEQGLQNENGVHIEEQ